MNYEKLLQGILDVGEEMLVAGAEVNRAEDSILRMCEAYGCDRVNVFIITSNIQVTLETPDGKIVTQIRRVTRNDSNFDRVDYLNDLSRYICEHKPDVDTLRQRFDQVMSRKGYPTWVNYLGSALIAGAFAVFFGGKALDGIAAVLVGIFITFANSGLAKWENNQLVRIFTVSFLSGLLSLLLVFLGIGQNSDKIMIGAIMLLVPGIAMTNSIRDMLVGDIGAGLLRLVNSVLVAVSIAAGFALSILITGGGALW